LVPFAFDRGHRNQIDHRSPRVTRATLSCLGLGAASVLAAAADATLFALAQKQRRLPVVIGIAQPRC
jgi:hypothetical protein